MDERPDEPLPLVYRPGFEHGLESEIRSGTVKLPKLQVGLDAIAAGRLRVVDDVSPEELATMQALPPKFSAADKTNIAVSEHRKWTLLTDERAMLAECSRRTITTLRTERRSA